MTRTFQTENLATMAAVALSLMSCISEPDDLLGEEDIAKAEQAAYYLSNAVWSIERIPVCWENPGGASDMERNWVRQAAAESWAARANIEFTGWGACASTSGGIRIRIADVGPHVKALGNGLNGMIDGMVLNFTFQNWSPSCQWSREFCIRVIAVHEFGHALAFAHEQNRPDRPSSCTEPAQGSNGNVLVGAWDLNSVMNYCNPSWNGNGQLSATDVMAVQQIYGARLPAAGDEPADFNGDGKIDYCQRFGSDNLVGSRIRCTISTGSGFGSTYTSGVVDWGYAAGRAWVDFNGDGRADYCRLVGVSNHYSSYVQCTVSTGTGFGATYTSGIVDWGYEVGRAWVDFNGDGRADYCRLVGVSNLSSSYVQCTVSTDTGFGATYTSGIVDWGYAAGRAWVDFNGDGRADYCRLVGIRNLSSSYVQCTVSTGTGFGATYTSGIVDWGYETGRAWTDFNGDGQADYCRLVGVSNLSSSYVQCTVSTGMGFGATYMSGIVDWGYEAGRAWTDFNGDGQADYCRLVGVSNFSSSYVQCTASTGSGFGATYTSGIVDWGYEAGRRWTDFSGDQKADYCRVVGSSGTLGVQCTVSNGTGFGTAYTSPVLF